MLICDICKKKHEHFNTDCDDDSDISYFLSNGRDCLRYTYGIVEKDINFVCQDCYTFLNRNADKFNKKFEEKRKELIKKFGQKLLKKLSKDV